MSKAFGDDENDLRLGTMYCRLRLVLMVLSFGLNWLVSKVKISLPSIGLPGITISTPPSPKSANSVELKALSDYLLISSSFISNILSNENTPHAVSTYLNFPDSHLCCKILGLLGPLYLGDLTQS